MKQIILIFPISSLSCKLTKLLIYDVYFMFTEYYKEKWVPDLHKSFGNLLEEGHQGRLDEDSSLDFIYSRISSDVH